MKAWFQFSMREKLYLFKHPWYLSTKYQALLIFS